MIALLKSFAPSSLYFAGLLFAILAFFGQTRWALLLLIFLSPLRNVVDRLQDYPLGNQFLDILFAGMLVGWVASCVFTRTPLLEKSYINLIAIFLVIYIFISLAVGNNWLYGELSFDISDIRVQDAKNFCMLPMLFFLTLNSIKEKKWVWRTFAVMCGAMLIMGYYAMSQIYWYSALVSRDKINGTFVFLGPNEVAAFYDVSTIIMMSLYFSMKKGWKKIVLLVLILMNMYCLIFMISRAAYAATFVGLFLLFAFKSKKYLILLLLVAIFWQVALPEKARERIAGTRNESGELDESAAARVSLWHQSIQIFQDNPLAGIGFGSFRHLGFGLSDTHNIYMKIATEQGVVGLALFAILIMCFLKEGWTLYKKGEDEESRGFGLGFFIAVFVVLINNMFGDRWAYYELSAYWWVYAALVARLNAISRQPKVVQTEPVKSNKTAKPGKLKTSRKFQRSIDKQYP